MPMTVNELLTILNNCVAENPDTGNMTICIPIERKNTKNSVVVGLPTMNIQSVGEGFDWDSGKIFLFTEKKLKEVESPAPPQLPTLPIVKEKSPGANHTHTYSKSMHQAYPRRCIICGEKENKDGEDI